MSAIAELENVSKAFDAKMVLYNVNLQVYQGEILALLGPNGSGKSTLLKTLALLTMPSSGQLKFNGELVAANNVERLRQQTTLVFQKTTLFEGSVYDNVAYGLKIRKVPKNQHAELIAQALRIVRLEGFEKRQAKRLSGGEQQRVAIARALVLKTKLLLLDEPTTNLDPKNAQIIEEVIATVNHELETTIVLATHNMFQAQTLPSRIALISNGKITQMGTPAEVFGKLSKNLASFAAVDNTFKGNAMPTLEGTTMVDLGNGFRVEVTEPKIGEISVFVSPQDIILTKTPFQSSARNVFKGKIVEIADLGSLVKLKVDVGRVFTVQVTKRSFKEMTLNLDSEVYIAFKASSVNVL
ncbi:MAG: ABC transporter ATP-binding protein [Candidatus Bathyarchaeota archaeon]|nr:ABC transporter ATP-binding protein [Candidatus Bathyarchaeota archaeon]